MTWYLWLALYFLVACLSSAGIGYLFGHDIIKIEGIDTTTYTSATYGKRVRNVVLEGRAIFWYSVFWPVCVPALTVWIAGQFVRDKVERRMIARRKEEAEVEKVLRSENLL